MTEISETDAIRDGKTAFEDVDMSAYSKKVFGMFTGSEQIVRLRFANHLVGAVIDRFGKDIMVAASDPEHFAVSLNVAVSPQFYAWLFCFGTDVEILSPENVRIGMKSKMEEVAALYR